MGGFLSTSMSLEIYREYLTSMRCWVDGEKTHGFHRQQRQCPVCRRKWSFRNRLIRLELLFGYAEGKTASAAAGEAGCSRNTAQAFFSEMLERSSEIVRLLLRGVGISLVGSAEQERELQRLERNPGRLGRRLALSRAVFFHGLSLEQRIELLAEPEILAAAELAWKGERGISFPREIRGVGNRYPRLNWRDRLLLRQLREAQRRGTGLQAMATILPSLNPALFLSGPIQTVMTEKERSFYEAFHALQRKRIMEAAEKHQMHGEASVSPAFYASECSVP
jgi:hypothetical protein